MTERALQILLVEDNPNDVELTLHALKKYHLANRVEVVRDGAEALDRLFGDPGREPSNDVNAPQLILLDLKLPKVDGLEVLRRLKTDPHTQSIPTVVLTSSNQERDVLECY